MKPKSEDASTLSNLLGISKMMVMQSDLHQLLSLIMAEATRLTNAERSTLYLLEESGDALISYIAQKAEVTQIRLPIGSGIAGHVARTGQTVNLEDVYQSDLFDRSWDKHTGYRTRSVLCLPIRAPDGEMKGVIQVLNRKKGRFSPADESVLSLFGSHVAVSIENLRIHENLKLMFKSAISALAEAVDKRDPVTAGHSERVTFYSVKIAEAMGIDADGIAALECAATLHDIGKIGIMDKILGKPARFTDEEFEVMKQHASITHDILKKFYFTGTNKDIPRIAGDHHERIDGSGYPQGLLIQDLSLPARILAVADVYDAVTAFDRPYRSAMPTPKALELLQQSAGKDMDQDVIETFISQELYAIERRRLARIDVDLFIEYQLLHDTATSEQAPAQNGRAQNLSERGLLFVAKEFIPVGSCLHVTIHFKRQQIPLLGTVARCLKVEPSGEFAIGIALLDQPEGSLAKVEQYLVDLQTPSRDDQ